MIQAHLSCLASPMTWRLDELISYLNWNESKEFCYRKVFGQPCPNIWTECRVDQSEAIRQAARSLDPDHRSRFIQTCLASYLLDPLMAPLTVKDCLQAFYEKDNLGLPFSWSELVQLNWKSVPIVLASRDRAVVNCFLVASGHSRSSLLPDNDSITLDKKAESAIDCAFRLASERYESSFFCWPLLSGTRNELYGGSIGLPVYLGFVSLAESLFMPKLLATGEIDQKGYVYRVEQVSQKAAAAYKGGFHGIVLPEENCTDRLETKGIEVLPVRDVEVARELWSNFELGQGRKMLFWIDSFKDNRPSLTNLLDIPSCLLPWLRMQSDTLREKLSLGQPDPSEMHLFVQKLETLLEKPARNLEMLELISGILDWSSIESLGLNHPELAWNICLIRIMLHNHKGQVSEAREWIGRALSFERRLERFEKGDQNIVLTYIHRLVGEYHNNYTFKPDVLNDFEPFFHQKLKRYQAGYEDKRARGEKPVWPNMGKLYGTMAQNYGFCGPDYIRQTEEMIQKAIQAFGDFEEPSYRSECLRDLSYLFFAYMDAGYCQEAENTLCRYLEVEKLKQFKPYLDNPYKLFCLFRFQAETGLVVPEHISWVLGSARFFKHEHPFQLILYNCGHIVGQPDKKRWLWERAVDSCFSVKGGATTHIMALLPLSCLWRYSLNRKDYLEPLVHKAIEPVKREMLDRNHFKVLLEAGNWQEVLDKVIDKKETLFPFSYR